MTVTHGFSVTLNKPPRQPGKSPGFTRRQTGPDVLLGEGFATNPILRRYPLATGRGRNPARDGPTAGSLQSPPAVLFALPFVSSFSIVLAPALALSAALDLVHDKSSDCRNQLPMRVL